jgi:DNA-3-methyladenine glycosylase
MRSPPFDRELLASSTLDAARSLLGARLVRSAGTASAARVGRIVEVEAYVGHSDLASHAHRGMTRRNAVMFGRPGGAYVYLVYGMHHCLNVVTEPAGVPAALLIRAVEPMAGVEEMRRARVEAERPRGAARHARAAERLACLPATRLASGPGLVCAAFSIDLADDAADLCEPDGALRLEVGEVRDPLQIAAGPRIGVGYAPEPWRGMPWRFWLAGNASVSRSEGSGWPATVAGQQGVARVTA